MHGIWQIIKVSLRCFYSSLCIRSSLEQTLETDGQPPPKVEHKSLIQYVWDAPSDARTLCLTETKMCPICMGHRLINQSQCLPRIT